MTNDKIIEICDKIKANVDNGYKKVWYCHTTWTNSVKWASKATNTRPAFAWHPLGLDLHKSEGFIRNPLYDTDFDLSWNLVMALDAQTQGVYYYPELNLRKNARWHDYTGSPDEVRIKQAYVICGEYSFKPFTFFKNEEQIIKFCTYQKLKLDKQYQELTGSLHEKGIEFWSNYEKNKKNKIINNKLRKISQDFK